MNEWELTDDEIQVIIKAGAMTHATFGSPEMRQAIDRDIATAAQKRLVEWMDSVWVADFRVGSVTLPFEVADSLKAALGVK